MASVVGGLTGKLHTVDQADCYHSLLMHSYWNYQNNIHGVNGTMCLEVGYATAYLLLDKITRERYKIKTDDCTMQQIRFNKLPQPFF